MDASRMDVGWNYFSAVVTVCAFILAYNLGRHWLWAVWFEIVSGHLPSPFFKHRKIASWLSPINKLLPTQVTGDLTIVILAPETLVARLIRLLEGL